MFDKKTYIYRSKYFIFDMDGVILDIESINYKAYKDSIYICLGKTMNIEEYNLFFKGKRGIEGLKNLIINYGIKDENNVVIKELSDEVIKLKYVLLNEVNLKEFLIPGILDFLEYLKSSGGKIGLATSTIRGFVEIILKKIGIESYFDVIICAEDISMGKPNPEIFTVTFDRLGGRNVNEGLVFEDSIAGINSSISAGLLCMGIGNVAKDVAFPSEKFIYLGDDFNCFKNMN